jgi:hypothetical protein
MGEEQRDWDSGRLYCWKKEEEKVLPYFTHCQMLREVGANSGGTCSAHTGGSNDYMDM